MSSIFLTEQSLGNWLVHDYRRRMLRQATRHAYQVFVRKYPKSADVLFDEHFLTHKAVPVLDAYLRDAAPSPAALAEACTAQWGFETQSRKRFIAELIPIAADFLSLVEVELRSAWNMSGVPAPSGTPGLASG